MAIQSLGLFNRNATITAFFFERDITVAAGSNRRLLLGRVSGRPTVEIQASLTYAGVPMTPVGNTSTGPQEVAYMWQMVDPPVGTAKFREDNTVSTNDGAWWYMVIDDSVGDAVGYLFEALESSQATTATPPATVPPGHLAMVIGGSGTYSGGGVLAGTTQIAPPVDARSGGYRVGGVPALGPWPLGQIGAYTVVVPMGGVPVPTLTSPTAGTPGTTTITISATSDSPSDGTMRFLRRVGGTAASAATIASTGESQAATANPQSRVMSGFTAGSANNYVDMVQVGAGGNSNVVTAGPFTMASAAATAVTLSGPSGGVNGVASTNFTAGVNGAISGSLLVTPSAGGGGGTFSPTSVTLTSGSPTATFTYTPASTGAKSITVTNNGGLTNPSAITYTVTAGALSIITDPLLDKAGAARIGYTVSKVYATRLSDDVQVKVWTNVVTNGAGRLVLTDAALTAADHLISSYTAGGVKPAGAKVYLPA